MQGKRHSPSIRKNGVVKPLLFSYSFYVEQITSVFKNELNKEELTKWYIEQIKAIEERKNEGRRLL